MSPTVDSPAPNTENGLFDQAPETAPAAPAAAPKPRTKTTALRNLLKEGITESEKLIREARERWGYEVNSADLSNARKAEKDAAEGKKPKKKKAAKPAAVTETKATPAPVTSNIASAQILVTSLCTIWGTDTIGAMVESVRKAAHSALGTIQFPIPK